MAGFEPLTFGVRISCTANWATTNVREAIFVKNTLYFNKLDGKLESFCVIKLVKCGEPFFSMNRSVISSIRFRCLVLWRDDCAEISHLFPVSSFWISFFGFTMNLLTKSPKPLKVKNVSDLKRKFIEQNGEREVEKIGYKKISTCTSGTRVVGWFVLYGVCVSVRLSVRLC